MDSSDRLVLGVDPVAVDYKHAPAELSPFAWTALSLVLSAGFRLFSEVSLAGLSMGYVGAGLYRRSRPSASVLDPEAVHARLKLDPDESDF